MLVKTISLIQFSDKKNLWLLVLFIGGIEQRIGINAKHEPKSHFVQFLTKWPHVKPMVENVHLSRPHRAVPKCRQLLQCWIATQIVRVASPALLMIANDQNETKHDAAYWIGHRGVQVNNVQNAQNYKVENVDANWSAERQILIAQQDCQPVVYAVADFKESS